MLNQFLDILKEELNIEGDLSSPKPGYLQLDLQNDLHVIVSQNSSGVYHFSSNIASCEGLLNEDLLLQIMEANLFGKKTYGAVIGLTEDENTLTLFMHLDSNHTYGEWKLKLEDFVNVLEHWKKLINNSFVERKS